MWLNFLSFWAIWVNSSRIHTTCLCDLFFLLADCLYNFHSNGFITCNLFIFSSPEIPSNYVIHFTVYGYQRCFQSLPLLNKRAQMHLWKCFCGTLTEVEILLCLYLTLFSNNAEWRELFQSRCYNQRALCQPHTGNWLSWQARCRQNFRVLKRQCPFSRPVSPVTPAGGQAALEPGSTKKPRST